MFYRYGWALRHFVFARRFAILLLSRAALRFVITFVFAALSNAWYTARSFSRITFVSESFKAAPYALRAVFTACFFTIFCLRRFVFWRSAFFADLVIGILVVKFQLTFMFLCFDF